MRLKTRFAGALAVIATLLALPVMHSYGQEDAGKPSGSPQHNSKKGLTTESPATDSGGKRIFGIIPNYRTSPSLVMYKPLSKREKFKLASEDAFDRGTFALAAAFAGQAQLSNSNPSFGQGAQAYVHYFGTACADLMIGDFMTEAVFPTVLHEDPRYFRRGVGNGWSRLGYAMGQIFWTHTDSGGTQFNFSEIAGNSAAVAISNAYYPDTRNAADALSRLGMQIGVDMAGNILKEFWPDLTRAFSSRHHSHRP